MKYYDWLVVFGVLGFFLAGLATTFISYYLYDESQTPEDARAVIEMAEVNPWFRKLLMIEKVNNVVTLIVPAIVTTIYFVLRKKIKDEESVAAFAFMIFFFGVADFLNDLAALLGLLVGSGMLF